MNVLLIVGGGVAAYKACLVARELGRMGHAVRVVLTEAGARFVQPVTFEALTGQPVFTSLWQPRLGPMEHIDQARWADVVAVVPATADLMARAAQGLAGDLATTLLLAADRPLVLAPAMNPVMWSHPATRANVATLAERGAVFAGPASGEMACGETGAGRLVEPEEIARVIAGAAGAAGVAGVAGAVGAAGGGPGGGEALGAAPGDAPTTTPGADLAGVRILMTAGPTREHLDPARFLSNPSTGTMAFAIAAEAARRGARVCLVLGPVAKDPPPGCEVVPVVSAADMAAAVEARWAEAEVFIGAAAVADWTPKAPATQKQAKVEGPMTLELVRTKDILRGVVEARRPGQLVVGFAAESHDVLARAAAKMARKGADILVANQIGVAGSGFGSAGNRAAVLVADRPAPDALRETSKAALAAALLDAVAARRAGGPGSDAA